MKKNPYPGKFIVFEGLDGSGQTTQAGFLKDFLIKKGYQVVLTKEPTLDSRAGKKIRKVVDKKQKISPGKLQKLFTEDRKKHLKNLIIPALKKGKIVISDRYFFSTFAYGVANGLSLDWLIKINNKFLMPDLTFILKVIPKICLERIKKRGEKRTLFEEKSKLAKVWQTYKILPGRFSTFARRKASYGGSAEALCEGGENVYIIDGEKPIKEVFKEVKNIVLSELNL